MPFEIERKYVIEMPDFDALEKYGGFTVSRIVQTYLRSAPAVTKRVRRRDFGNRIEYTETVKVRVDPMTAEELERLVDEREYMELCEERCPGTRPIEKVRYTLEYACHTLEIDVYPQWLKSCVMEVELKSGGERVEFPPEIRIIKEVTGDKRYSNAAMSRAFPPEII